MSWSVNHRKTDGRSKPIINRRSISNRPVAVESAKSTITTPSLARRRARLLLIGPIAHVLSLRFNGTIQIAAVRERKTGPSPCVSTLTAPTIDDLATWPRRARQFAGFDAASGTSMSNGRSRVGPRFLSSCPRWGPRTRSGITLDVPGFSGAE